ncbi:MULTISPECIES: TRAP transporter large permease [unclassified Pseudomonas]|uniref:TRAP transporter large permease n=1 Tax=unclassified Pseudomonas TaxID=196821 RepID=UPI00131BC75E|nr:MULTISPECIES: TRAP transporter large permease [unclassified Pseudomonas]
MIIGLALAAFVVLILIGTPVVFCLGIAAAIALMASGVPMAIVTQRIYGGLESFTIMAIPFFVLAGLIMEKGGIARRFIDFATSLVGWIRGSLLFVSVLACTGFSAVSGSGSADTAAIGSMTLPQMKRRDYNIDFASAILAAGGCIGAVIPPSIMMVVIGTISNVSIGALFLGGIVPGLLMCAGLMFACYWHVRKGGAVYEDSIPFCFKRVISSAVSAIPAGVIAIVLIGGIVGGVMTPTEAAGVAVFMSILVGRYIYRELEFRELPGMLLRASAMSAAVMVVISTASVFAWLITSQNVPQLLGEYLGVFADDKILFLLVVNVMLLLIGTFMEGISAILIVMPMLMPLARQVGIDPVHFSVIVVMNLSVGMLTPPYGSTLFVAATVAGRSVVQVSRQVGLPLLVLVVALLITTYCPLLVTWVNNLR